MASFRSRRTLLGISALAAAWFTAVAIVTSGIGRDLRSLALGFYSGVALLVAWLVAILVFRKTNPPLRFAVVVPLLLALGTLLWQLAHSSNPFFRLRFLASRPALARIAEAALVAEPPASRQRIGLFLVDRIEVDQGHVEFLAPCGFLDDCGVAYVPLGQPAQLQGAVSRSLGGPWYHFRRHW